jgi:hypothetical protein
MTRVPNQLVTGCIEGVVQSYCELGDPQARAEVSTLLGHYVDVTLANRVDDGLQLRRLQRPQIGRIVDAIQNRHPDPLLSSSRRFVV